MSTRSFRANLPLRTAAVTAPAPSPASRCQAHVKLVEEVTDEEQGENFGEGEY